MRRIGRTVLALLLLLLALIAASVLRGAWRDLRMQGSGEQGDRPRTFFDQVGNHPVRFSLAGSQRWVLVYPVISLPGAEPPTQSIGYRLRYRVLDSTGHVLRTGERIITHRNGLSGRAPEGRLAERGEPYIWWSQSQWIDLSANHRAEWLETQVDGLRGLPRGAAVHLRTFLVRRLDDDAAMLRQRRISREESDRIAAPYLAPLALLPPDTLLELHRRKLEPAPAAGMDGSDYRAVTVRFNRRLADDDPVSIEPTRDASIVQSSVAWPITPGMPASLQTDENTIIAIGARDERNQPMQISATWSRDGIVQARQFAKGEGLLTVPAGTVVVFESPHAGWISAIDVSSRRKLLPDGPLLSTWALDPGHPLTYAVIQGRNDAVPNLRVDLRALEARPVLVRLEWLDAKGMLRGTQLIPAPFSLSRTARFANRPAQSSPEATRLELAVPAGAGRLRLSSDGRALATIFSRPAVNRDVSAKGQPARRWFSYLPQDATDARRVALQLQPALASPAATTNSEDSGRGNFHALMPAGRAVSRPFLVPTPHSPGPPDRQDAMPNRFRSLGRMPVTLQLDGPADVPAIAPRIAFLRSDGAASTLILDVDGQRMHLPVVGKSGLLTLRGLNNGRHRIAIDSAPPGHWLLGMGDAPDWLLRRLWQLDPNNALQLPMDGKPGVLTLLVFSTEPGMPSAPHARILMRNGIAQARQPLQPARKQAAGDAWPLWQPGIWHGPYRFLLTLPAGTARVTLDADTTLMVQPLRMDGNATQRLRIAPVDATGGDNDAL